VELPRRELEIAIAAAQEREHSILRHLVTTQGDARRAASELLDAAEREVGELWRRLGTQFGAEVVVPLDLGFEPAADVSGAMLLQDEYGAFLLFNISTRRGNRDGVAIVRFSAESTKFGLPNDEALAGHPLSARGLRAYRCGEVLNSSWLVEEQRRNSVRFPDYKLPCRHFVFTFHDSSFEVLARKIEHELRPAGDHAVIALECLQRLGRHW
jgi:hypothetical protein